MFVTVYFLCSLVSSYADLSQYDQRQTGDFNVQVDLKDVQIFGILKGDKEEYVDYDYAYDYSELTIKPQHGTTPKPHATSTNASTQPPVTRDNSTTAPTTVLQEHTIAPVNNELTTLFTASTVAPDKDDNATTVANYPHITTEHNVGTIKNVTAAPTAGPTRRNCRKGYVLNKKGQCQLKVNTPENALLRLVKLSQKLKLRRENKSNYLSTFLT